MKSRLLIIIGMIIAITISVTLTELSHQIDLCEMSSDYFDNIPEMNMSECLEFLSNPDLAKPSVTFDYTYSNLSMIETIVIVGVAASMIIVITWKNRK